MIAAANHGTGPRANDRPCIAYDIPVAEAMDQIMPVMQAGFDPLYGEAWNHMQTLSMLSMPHCRWTIAFDSSALEKSVGFCISRQVGPDDELLMIAVSPTERRLGIARYLLHDLVRDSKVRACKKLFLEVRSNNMAQNLYRSMGFRHVGTRKGYYQGAEGKKFDALTYVLSHDNH